MDLNPFPSKRHIDAKHAMWDIEGSSKFMSFVAEISDEAGHKYRYVRAIPCGNMSGLLDYGCLQLAICTLVVVFSL